MVEKTEENKFRHTFILYDNVSDVVYNDKCYRIKNKEQAIGSIALAQLKENCHIFLTNGVPDTWDFNIPFPYNEILFKNKEGIKIYIYFNAEAYICNDNGDTLERIFGY